MSKHADIAKELTGGERISMWIGGEHLAPDGAARPLRDPFTGESFAEAPDADADTVNRAVEAARTAQKEWQKTPPRARAKALRKLSGCLREMKRDLVRAECINAGVPKMLATRFSVAAAVRSFEYFAEWTDKIYGDVVPINTPNVIDFTRREPVGVVGAITAWNTPTLFIGSKVAPALAAGNAIVLKPSERAPLPAFLFAKAAAEAGLPAGLINVIYGGGETGNALVSHDGVDMVTFTGGTPTGEKIVRAAGIKRTALELGGKSAAVVYADANLDVAAFQLCFGSFGLTGQACAASSRLVIERSVHDDLVEKMKATAQGMIMGDPLEDATMLGPMIDAEAVARCEAMVDEATKAGASVAFGGEAVDGKFYRPTLLTGASEDAAIAQQEVFGPVTCSFAFDKPKEAVTIANRTRYGLAASVWSSNIQTAHRTADKLAAGYVWINAYGTIPYSTPFGGIKSSGHGREGGREAIEGFTRLKNIFVQL